jgi:hypothetical protein
MTNNLELETTRKPEANLIFGGLVFGFLILCAILGLIWTPYPPNAQDFAAQLVPPSLAHPFGTDNFGRDTLSRMLRGYSVHSQGFLVVSSTILSRESLMPPALFQPCFWRYSFPPRFAQAFGAPCSPLVSRASQLLRV